MKIFIASSDELEPERIYLTGNVCWRLLNLHLPERVEPLKWEYLDSSIGVEHKQAEYNRALATCDGVVVLFWRKYGQYTESEFLTALDNAPTVRRVAVMCKETGEEPSTDTKLAEFKRNCAARHGVELHGFSVKPELRTLFLSVVFDLLRDKYPAFEIPDNRTLARCGLLEDIP